ncbi:MAG: DNA-binding protein [Spirochaetes bacterium]|nr:MAG: DNA-binding protein [Spirochaetota bacterium]
MNEKTIDNWVKLSEYDFETAGAMLKAGRYLYVVFTCRQAVEKLLKAIYVQVKNSTPPYTHNLIKLAEECNLINQIDIKTIAELNSCYIKTRYSEELEKLSAAITRERTEVIYRKTEELIQWLKKEIR